MSDLHVAPVGSDPAAWHSAFLFDRSLDLVAKAISFFRLRHVDMVVVSGDLTHNGDHPSTSMVYEQLAKAAIPIFVASGNHDVIESESRLAKALPANGTNIKLVTAHGDVCGRVRIAGTHVKTTRLRQFALTNGPDTRSWGAEELAIWVSHYPPISIVPQLEAAGLRNAEGAIDIWRTADLLESAPCPVLIVHGHQHVRALVGGTSVVQYGQQALIEAPHGVSVVEIRSCERRRVVSISSSKLGNQIGHHTDLCGTTSILNVVNGEWSTDADTMNAGNSCARNASPDAPCT